MKDNFKKKVNFRYLKYDKIFLNKFDSLLNFKNNTYGINLHFLNFCKYRFELLNNDIFMLNKKYKYIFLRIVRSFISRNYINFFNFFQKNIITLYKINNYKTWRHVRGLPVRGQRTWSNANSVYYSNTFLRKFLFRKASLYYGSSNTSIANVAILAEYANCIWKNQWYSEWNSGKIKRLQFDNAYSAFKVDLFSMSKFNIKFEKKQKVVSKRARRKKKVEVKNVFVVGFERGFTKSYLKKSNVGLKTNKVQLITSKSVEKPKRNIKKKVTSVKKVVKKIKKSIWD